MKIKNKNFIVSKVILYNLRYTEQLHSTLIKVSILEHGFLI